MRVITRLNIGGPARQALLLTRELRDDFPTLLVAGRPLPSEGELEDQQVQITRVPLIRPLNPPADALALLAIRRLLNRARPEILHTHMAKAGTLGRIAAVTSPIRPRTVHTFHGHVLQDYFSPVLERAFIGIERWLARRTDVLIAVSEEIREQLLELGIGRRDQFEVVPLGFDLSAFLSVDGPTGGLRRDLHIGPEHPLIGVLGRLAPIKDHGTLLRAIARLPDVHLAVLGDGELRRELERSARELGIARRVHFTGWRLDVAPAIADMDVVALTSLNEGTPVSLIEAHACARPVVATDVGGVRSVVENGVTGFLAQRGDADQVARLLQLLLDDVSRRAAMGEEGRRRVVKRYSKERLASDIRSLYGDLLTRR